MKSEGLFQAIRESMAIIMPRFAVTQSQFAEKYKTLVLEMSQRISTSEHTLTERMESVFRIAQAQLTEISDHCIAGARSTKTVRKRARRTHHNNTEHRARAPWTSAGDNRKHL